MKTITDKEKKQILEELEAEQREDEKINYVDIEDLEEKKTAFKTAVKANIEQRKDISIKPLEADIIKIKAKAIAKGVSYQTLINSIIHQFANDKLVES